MPTTTDSWCCWPQPQPGGADFGIMPAGMVLYDCRTVTAAHIPRPEVSQHFLPTTFSSAAPIHSPASPQYHAPVSYGGYNPYGAPSMLDAPFKPRESLERMQPRGLVTEPAAYGDVYERVDGLPCVKRSCSPSVKTEASLDPPRLPASEVTAPTTPAQATPVHQFNTAIDNVMRVIEAKREILEPMSEAEPVQKDEKKETGRDTQAPRSRGKPKRKRFCCDIPGCSKMFVQKNNLDTHRRSHTGESPYVCPYCPRRFTQSINLKTHINRHTGAHQNTYHVEEIEAFNAKLAAVKDKSMISEEDKEMAKYLSDVHNLANKGIKGRGKGPKVKRVLTRPPPQQQSAPATSPSITTTHTGHHQAALLPQQQQLPTYDGLPYCGLDNLAA
ncbi:hypothetical protein VTG60DRAFT_2811 [Thermothelomyces hinnuleus]